MNLLHMLIDAGDDFLPYMKLLIDYGADVNRCINSQVKQVALNLISLDSSYHYFQTFAAVWCRQPFDTPLMLACRRHHPRTALLLLCAGSDAGAVNHDGEQALDLGVAEDTERSWEKQYLPFQDVAPIDEI